MNRVRFPAESRVDRVVNESHSRQVGLFSRRGAGLICALSLSVSVAAECAGWQWTPDARQQSCRDAACPLHRHHGAALAHLTQAPNDECCVQSPQRESNPAGTVFASTMTLAVLSAVPSIVTSIAPAVSLAAPWETASPPTRVPKHLLLSVLLV